MFEIYARGRLLAQEASLAEADVRSRSMRFVGADVCIYHGGGLVEVIFRNGASLAIVGPDAPAPTVMGRPVSDLHTIAADDWPRPGSGRNGN